MPVLETVVLLTPVASDLVRYRAPPFTLNLFSYLHLLNLTVNCCKYKSSMFHIATTGAIFWKKCLFVSNKYDRSWFIIPLLCWTLFIAWGIFDVYNISGVGCAPVFRWLVVTVLTDYLLFCILRLVVPVSIAERSKACIVYNRLNIGIACLNPAWGMDVCPRVSVLCCPVSVEALRRADPPAKESYQMSLYVDQEAH
jgi:hypothetical protein